MARGESPIASSASAPTSPVVLVTRTLRVTCVIAAAIGAIATATALFAVLAIVLGNWIS